MTKTNYTAVLCNSISFVIKKKYEGRRYILKLVDTKMFFSKDVQTLNGGFVRVETLVRKGKLLILIS